MMNFYYSYPTRVYFGVGSAKKAFSAELSKFGKTVMFTFGGGSVKKTISMTRLFLY